MMARIYKIIPSLFLSFLITFSIESKTGEIEINSSESLKNFNRHLEFLKISYGFPSVEYRSELLSYFNETQIDWIAAEQNLSKDDLELLFKSLSTINFYNVDDQNIARDLYRVFQIYENLYTPHQEMIYKMYHASFNSRLIKIANEISERHEFIEKFIIADNSQSGNSELRTILLNHSHGKMLNRESISGRDKWFAIMIDPLCGPSMQLIQEFKTEPELMDALNEYGILIIPQYVNYDQNWLANWRSEWSILTGWIYSFSEWPEIDDWFTPSFYVYENKSGNLVNIDSKNKFVTHLYQHFVN